MSQKQCPWCGHCGPRYDESNGERAHDAHSDGTQCVCRHVTCASRRSAHREHGRYFDENARAWRCFGCGTAREIALDLVER